MKYRQCPLRSLNCNAQRSALNGGSGLISNKPTWDVEVSPTSGVDLNILGVTLSAQVDAKLTGSSLLCSGHAGLGGMFWSGHLSGQALAFNDKLAVNVGMAFGGSKISSILLDLEYKHDPLLVRLGVASAIAECSPDLLPTTGKGVASLSLPSGNGELVFLVAATYDKCAKAGSPLFGLSGVLEKAKIEVFGFTFAAAVSLDVSAMRKDDDGDLFFSGKANGTLSASSGNVDWFFVDLGVAVEDNILTDVDTMMKLDFQVSRHPSVVRHP